MGRFDLYEYAYDHVPEGVDIVMAIRLAYQDNCVIRMCWFVRDGGKSIMLCVYVFPDSMLTEIKEEISRQMKEVQRAKRARERLEINEHSLRNTKGVHRLDAQFLNNRFNKVL